MNRAGKARSTVQREFTATATHFVTDPTPVRAMPRRHGPGLRPRRLLLTVAVCALVALSLPVSVPVPAQDREERSHARLPESVRRIERETGGKVLQVRPIQRGDREIYRMKVLTPDGRVKIVQDDPKRPRERDREPPRSEDREPDPDRRRGDEDSPPEHF
ncbi:hypothetical protein [Pseudomarimonas salicorniae]|uniref:Peptidase propeptide and YPEB domain-containing protein n=1 Tax=Pseudomarimonas salicorniae TaxID=2933270 RepID=A0ABT0GJA9_9GAMM|nr:hypothetical protein [Lysobacter sp. CAU 1642]MCK7594437.1 hypothetical protein [Lysobacter sp. CAU 1642]